jgi:hypothetical protein
MAEVSLIWTPLATRLLADWQPHFDRAQRALTNAPNSSGYFTRRMDVAVSVFDELMAFGIDEARAAASRAVSSSEIDNPKQIAESLFSGLLRRCVDTIQAQIANGLAQGMQNTLMLEGHASSAVRAARERHSAQGALLVAELDQHRRRLVAAEEAAVEEKGHRAAQRRRDDRRFYADLVFGGLAVVGSVVAYVGPRWTALAAAAVGLVGAVTAWLAHSRDHDTL